MILGFLTDPHIGIDRLANTTVDSRRRFRRAVFCRTLAGLKILRENGAERLILTGDLFDKFSNDEESIAQGASIIDELDFVLAGNHDEKNDVNIRGSLRMLQLLHGYNHQRRIIAAPLPNQAYCQTEMGGGWQMTFIPHVLTQEIFEASLQLAVNILRPVGAVNILCLHCNYGMPGETYKEVTKDSTSLYLSDENRKLLEEYFDYIFIGHEHPPKKVSEQTQILGNIMPLTFGEMGDRFVYTLNTKTLAFGSHPLFEARIEHEVIKAQDMISELEIILQPEVLFADIQGVIPHTEMADAIRGVRELWKNNPSLLMVRNGIQSVKPSMAAIDESTAFMPKTLPEIVSASVRETPFAGAYDEATAAVAEDAARSPARKGPTDGNY